jgi:hypothetical protein
MKVIIESIITLVENEDMEQTLSRTSKFADSKVKDDYLLFALDTQEIFNIAKSNGIEEANKSIDKVLRDYSDKLKAKVSSTINS